MLTLANYLKAVREPTETEEDAIRRDAEVLQHNRAYLAILARLEAETVSSMTRRPIKDARNDDSDYVEALITLKVIEAMRFNLLDLAGIETKLERK